MATEDVFGIVGTTQAGNFHVEQAVAEGGFGVVYRAQHGGFRAPVALKCLKIPEEMNQRQREVFLEKFREEAELLFRLSASIPEVVRPLHIDVLHLKDGGFVPFLAMEWLSGESLDAIITRRAEQGQAPLGVHKLIRMLRPVAHALSRAHRFMGPRGTESIVHRDLKPENIFVATIGDRESVKILDFGIAKARRLASEAAGRVTGQPIDDDENASFTPAYGAPEQWAPKRFGATGPWTDVWGLALTMVEVLVGGPAIDGDTYEMRRQAIDERRRPTPRALGAVVSDEVESAFERALAVDPRKRAHDMEAFWTDLERAVGLPPSFGVRDLRREEDGESFPAAEIAAAPAPAPHASSTFTPRLGRIDLHGAERSAADKANAAPGRASPLPARGPLDRAGPASARGPASSDFSDVFGPAERSQAGALAPEKVPSSRRGGGSPRVDALELDFDAPSSRRRGDASDLEMALPTESGPSSGPWMARGPASDRGCASRSALGDELLEAPLEVEPIAVHRPRSRPDLSLEVGPSAPGREGRGNLPAVPRSEPNTELRELGARIRGPLAVLLLALVISLGEIAYTRITGTPLMLGPIRPFWLAAPIALIGVAFTFWRFMGDRDDG